MMRKLRSRPSMSPSQRVIRNSAVANETEAPSAHSTPAPTSAQRPAMSPLLPQTSSASARPTSATGIASSTRREGRSPPADPGNQRQQHREGLEREQRQRDRDQRHRGVQAIALHRDQQADQNGAAECLSLYL